MVLRRVWFPSPNRGGRRKETRLIIIHTAEGARSFQALGKFFGARGVKVSTQVGIDDTPGTVGEYVRSHLVSYGAGPANAYSTQAELCAFAAWSRDEWLSHPVMLENTAAWIAEEAARYDIPIVRSTSHGVCGHVDVSGPGGHWDPGSGFPWDLVLDMAEQSASSSGARVSMPGRILGLLKRFG